MNKDASRYMSAVNTSIHLRRRVTPLNSQTTSQSLIWWVLILRPTHPRRLFRSAKSQRRIHFNCKRQHYLFISWDTKSREENRMRGLVQPLVERWHGAITRKISTRFELTALNH